MVNLFHVLTLLTLFSLGACAHKPTPAPWQLASGLPTDQALIVLDGVLNAGGHLDQQHECHLHLRYHDGRDLKLAMRPGERRYFWTAPVGRYEVKHLSCGLFSRFEMEEFPSFTLKKGQSYYFGKLRLTIESRESLTWSFEEMGRDRLLGQFLSLPGPIKDRVLSPYSEKRLTEELISKTPEGPSVRQTEGPKGYIQAESWPFSACLAEEVKRNPLRAGLYEFELSWQNPSLPPVLQTRYEQSLYTDQFRGCVDAVVEDWKPAMSGQGKALIRL